MKRGAPHGGVHVSVATQEPTGICAQTSHLLSSDCRLKFGMIVSRSLFYFFIVGRYRYDNVLHLTREIVTGAYSRYSESGAKLDFLALREVLTMFSA